MNITTFCTVQKFVESEMTTPTCCSTTVLIVQQVTFIRTYTKVINIQVMYILNCVYYKVGILQMVGITS